MDGKLDEKFMRLAIQKAEKNLKIMEGGPFGACIVKEGAVLAVARNTVLKSDATCHAEMNAIRIASRKIKTYDLSGSVIYSTTEPCPMCFSALHWARAGLIVYGTKIIDADKIGFNEMKISDRRLKTLGKSKIKLVPGFLRDECEQLLVSWNRLPDKMLY
ncbi:MAG: nucleoside deaminase [Candidatus Omnitrophota bacterium]